MDALDPLFEHFSPKAKVFFAGNLCETSPFDATDGLGHLHLLRAGVLQITDAVGRVQTIEQPSLLLQARPLPHRIAPLHASGVDLVCASIDLGSELNNPLVLALPDLLKVELAAMPRLTPTLALLFEESEHSASGQRAALDRLTEYLLILLLRHVIGSAGVNVGILSAMRDTRLQRAIRAIHEKPGYPWSLEELAELATLSRARFASRFKETTGTSPLNYLTQWRMGVACSMLCKGNRIERIASQVGYGSQSAFTRVFTKSLGVSPREWQTGQRARTAFSRSGRPTER